MRKPYLLTPGPAPVPPDVLLAMARPMVHHRTPAYTTVLAEVKEQLKEVFQTEQDVLIFVSTGTGCLEGAVVNLLSPGDTAIVVRAGKFGERWANICKAYGVEAVCLDVPWGDAVDPEEVARLLREHPETKAVFTQLCETSTGALMPIERLSQVVHERSSALFVVDAVSALAGDDLPMDAWDVDAVIGASQKALMLPPGLGFAALSERAWRTSETATLPKFYFNFKKSRASLAKNEDTFTGGVSMVMGLHQALRDILHEGLPRVFARHALLADAMRAGVRAMGLDLYAKAPSNIVSAVSLPEGLDGGALVKRLRNHYGVEVAGGQDQAKGRIVRVAHLGYAGRFDVITALAALEMGLNDLGHRAPYGAGVAAAEQVLRESELDV